MSRAGTDTLVPNASTVRKPGQRKHVSGTVEERRFSAA